MALLFYGVVPTGDHDLPKRDVKLLSRFLLTFRRVEFGYHVETPQAERNNSRTVRNAGVIRDYFLHYLGVITRHNIGGIERAPKVTESGRSCTKEIGAPDTGYKFPATSFKSSRTIAVNRI